MAETADGLLSILGSDLNDKGPVLELLESGDSRWMRDSKVNLQNILKAEQLSDKEVYLIGAAIAANAQNERLLFLFKDQAARAGASDEEIGEAVACASLLSANNVLYRFRHFVGKQKYEELPAKIKMNIMAKPILGKELFELISLAVSAVNGCEVCVTSHEQSVLSHGGSEERIWEAIRVTSIVQSVCKIV